MSSTGTFSPTSSSAKACAAVYAFLTGKSEAGDLGTYASNPLWQIVDGPSGSPRRHDGQRSYTSCRTSSTRPGEALHRRPRARFFTTDTAEFNVLEERQGNQHRLRPSSGPAASTRARPWCRTVPSSGTNNSQLAGTTTSNPPTRGDQLLRSELPQPGRGPDLQAAVHPPGDAVPDEPEPVDPAVQRRLRAPTYGPVPVFPPTKLATAQETIQPLSLQPSAREALLTSHGWKVVPNGVTTCVKPGTAAGQCGAGIAKGTR